MTLTTTDLQPPSISLTPPSPPLTALPKAPLTAPPLSLSPRLRFGPAGAGGAGTATVRPVQSPLDRWEGEGGSLANPRRFRHGAATPVEPAPQWSARLARRESA